MLPMKVIQITFNFPPEIGGVGQYVWSLSRCLKRRGIEVAVITIPITVGSREGEKRTFPVYRVRAFRLPALDPIPLNMFSLLRTLAKTQNFSIVHIHGHISFLSFFGALSCRLLSIPYVITHHGEGLPLSLTSRIHGHLRGNLFAKHVLRCSKKVISVNQYEVMTLTREYEIPREKIVVIPNGVDADHFTMSRTSDPSLFDNWLNKKVILSGGVLAKWKGFEYLIRALKLVVSKYDNVQLLITGDGPDKPRLQSLAVSLGLSRYVKFTGYLRADFLSSYHKLSYMYVLPSLYDVCPTVVLEAMASGKPVIVTSLGGQKELVVNGQNGIIVPPADIESLSQAILTLLSSEELASEMGKKGRRMVEEKFAWSKISNKILQVYKSVLAS